MEDYIAALDYIRGPSLSDTIDGSRVALWGTSFSGGHVLRVAAADAVPSRVGDILAIVSQVDATPACAWCQVARNGQGGREREGVEKWVAPQSEGEMSRRGFCRQ